MRAWLHAIMHACLCVCLETCRSQRTDNSPTSMCIMGIRLSSCMKQTPLAPQSFPRLLFCFTFLEGLNSGLVPVRQMFLHWITMSNFFLHQFSMFSTFCVPPWTMKIMGNFHTQWKIYFCFFVFNADGFKSMMTAFFHHWLQGSKENVRVCSLPPYLDQWKAIFLHCTSYEIYFELTL